METHGFILRVGTSLNVERLIIWSPTHMESPRHELPTLVYSWLLYLTPLNCLRMGRSRGEHCRAFSLLCPL